MGILLNFPEIPRAPKQRPVDPVTQEVLLALQSVFASYKLDIPPPVEINDLEGTRTGDEIFVMKGPTKIGVVKVRTGISYNSISFVTGGGNDLGSIDPAKLALLATLKPFQDFVDHVLRACTGLPPAPPARPKRNYSLFAFTPRKLL